MNSTRGIGSHPAARTLSKLQEFTEAVIALIRDYRPVAIKAVKDGGHRIFVPVTGIDDEALDGLFKGLSEVQSYGNTSGEPCYTSVQEGNTGSNEDSTSHEGYLVIDVIERLIIDLVNREGETELSTPLVRFATADTVTF